MDDPYIFRFVGDKLSDLTAGYIDMASAGLAGALGPVALAGVTLFITIYGVLVIAGKIQMPFQDFVVKAGKIAIIAAIALNAGNYMEWVVGSIQGLESGLVGAMTEGGSELDTTDTYALLDSSISIGAKKAADAWEKVGEISWYNISGWLTWLIATLLIYIAMILLFLICGALVVVAKFALTLMLAVGPLFVMSLIWAPTAGFFDRWLSQVLTYVFTILFLTAVLSMAITVFSEILTATDFNDPIVNPIFVALQILMIALILGYLITQVPGMASGLAGGAGLGALSMRQLVGAVMNPSRALGRMMMPSGNNSRTNSVSNSGSSGRMNTVSNPGYRAALQERLRSTLNRSGNTVTRAR